MHAYAWGILRNCITFERKCVFMKWNCTSESHEQLFFTPDVHVWTLLCHTAEKSIVCHVYVYKLYYSKSLLMSNWPNICLIV